MECYVAKLNVGPSILQMYSESELIGKVIPNSLDRIFKKESENEQNGIIKYSMTNDIEFVKNTELYKNMLLNKEELIKEYHSVVERFKATGEIAYSKVYMSLRTNLKTTINELVAEYSFLRNAEEIKLDSFSKGKVSEIQMGITYIDRVSKIEYFINRESIIQNTSKKVFFYDKNNERIYIPVHNIDEENVIESLDSFISEIQEIINSKKGLTDISKVYINIIYDTEYAIKEGKYKEIIITRVYPNGNPSHDRMKALRASKQETKYIATEGETFDTEEIKKETEEDAKLGYIEKIVSRGKNIIKSVALKKDIGEN